MLNEIEKNRIDNKYFNHKVYDYKYFFKKYNFYQKKVLDVGCGSGQNLRYFSDQSVGITYTDDDVIEFVSEKYNLNIKKFNIENDWPNDIGNYDIILNIDNIIHLSSPFKLLLEFRKVLRDDGIILLMIPQASSIFFQSYKSSLHPYAFNKKTLTYLMKKAGFSVVDTYGYIRRLPAFLNVLLNPVTKIFGPNIWMVARKNKGFKISDRNIRPDWIKEEIWNFK